MLYIAHGTHDLWYAIQSIIRIGLRFLNECYVPCTDITFMHLFISMTLVFAFIGFIHFLFHLVDLDIQHNVSNAYKGLKNYNSKTVKESIKGVKE